jgi:hypothetical protein
VIVFFIGRGVVGEGVMVCTGFDVMCVIAEKTKIYPHLRVVKNRYPQNDS